MDKTEIKKSEIIAELPPCENNPRNSEGDFALLKDGSILFAYSRYHGDSHEDHAPCDIAGMISRDGGKSFQHLPYLLAQAKTHGVSNIMSVSFCRLDNGELCLFYLCKKGIISAYYMCRALEDELHFGEPEICIDFDEDIYYVINNCRICKLPDGRLLVPAACHRLITENGEKHIPYFGSVKIFGCDSEGRNWKQISPEIEMPNPGHSETGLQEPGISILTDGRLYQYFRTDRCFQFESFSEDEGKSWSTPVPSQFTAPESPMLIAKNPFSGIYYAIWNPIPNYNSREKGPWIHAGRFPFVIAQSENGIDFPVSDFTAIETVPDHGYCYPAIHFLSASEMLISYCCGGKEDGVCLSKTRIRKITV